MKFYPFCSVVDCRGRGIWVPIIVLMESPVYGPTQQAELAIPLCGRHKRVATIDTVLPESTWQVISSAFAKDGKIMPPKSLLELDFRHAIHGVCS